MSAVVTLYVVELGVVTCGRVTGSPVFAVVSLVLTKVGVRVSTIRSSVARLTRMLVDEAGQKKLVRKRKFCLRWSLFTLGSASLTSRAIIRNPEVSVAERVNIGPI